MLALWHAIWQILHDKICSYSLTFYLLYLTRILTSNLAFYLTYIPTFYWTNIVKVWQFFWHVFWHSIRHLLWQIIWRFIWHFHLTHSDIYLTNILIVSDILPDICSDSLYHRQFTVYLTYILTSYFGILPGISLHSNPDILTNISWHTIPGMSSKKFRHDRYSDLLSEMFTLWLWLT